MLSVEWIWISLHFYDTTRSFSLFSQSVPVDDWELLLKNLRRLHQTVFLRRRRPNFWTTKFQNKTLSVLTSWFTQSSKKEKTSAVFSHGTHKCWILLLDTAAWGIMDVKVNISIGLFRLPVLFSASVSLYSAPTNVITLALYHADGSIPYSWRFSVTFEAFYVRHSGDVVKSEVPAFWFNTVGVNVRGVLQKLPSRSCK